MTAEIPREGSDFEKNNAWSEEHEKFKQLNPEERAKALNSLGIKIRPRISRLLLDHGFADAADDIWQSTVTKAAMEFDSFVGKSAVATWVSKIATNEALMHMRNKSRLRLEVELNDDVS